MSELVPWRHFLASWLDHVAGAELLPSGDTDSCLNVPRCPVAPSLVRKISSLLVAELVSFLF